MTFLKFERGRIPEKLDILLLFDYFPVKSENRFNKSKSESFGKLRNIKLKILSFKKEKNVLKKFKN